MNSSVAEDWLSKGMEDRRTGLLMNGKMSFLIMKRLTFSVYRGNNYVARLVKGIRLGVPN